MTARRVVFLLVAAAGAGLVVSLLWLGIAGHGAWAQEEVAIPPDAAKPLHQIPTEPPPPPRPEDQAPPLEQSLKQALSSDLMMRQQGLRGLAGNYREASGEVKTQIQQILREAALKGETAEIRVAGVNGLGAHVQDNWQTLVQATRDSEEAVVQAALVYLPLAPEGAAVEIRLEELTRSRNTSLSVQAVDLLMKRYGQQGAAGIQRLAGQLGNVAGDASAKSALQLTIIGRRDKSGADTGVVPVVTQTLASGANPVQRHAAAVVLGMICGGKTPRQEAFQEAALAEFKFEAKLEEPDLRPLPVLIERLRNDPYDLARESCAQALGLLASEKAAPALAEAVRKDPAAEVRVAAARALVMIPGTHALGALSEAVRSDSHARVREFAVSALGWMEDQGVIAPLIVATGDEDAEVRRLAAVQLGKLKPDEALESLTALFKDPDEDVRWAAVIAVDGLRTREAEDALVGAAQDVSPLVSHAAQIALQHLGSTRGGEDLHFRQRGDTDTSQA